jgi:3-isopropylmalate dehydrogenase
VGLPSVRRSDGSEVADEVVLDIRSDLDLYANLRPVRSWPGVRGPLGRRDIEYMILRENTEGLYASRTGGLVLGDNVATDTMIITRRGTERAADHAFRLAQRSKGRPRDGRKVVTCVDKANTLKSFVFFRKIFDEVAARYPEVQAEYELADAMTARMVLAPDTLNVVVCENMLGDLLSDLAAATVGGMGLAPSANVGLRHGMFEPTHGSAPGIAGRNQANPIATILSGAMMLEWLGDRGNDDKCVSAARNIKSAVEKTLAAGMKTNDLGGTETTSGFATAVIANLEVG